MPAIPPKDIYDAFFAIAAHGDEATAKEFLIAHLKEFPENERGAIIAAFFEAALREEHADMNVAANFQGDIIKTIDQLETIKKELQEKDRLLQIKETL